MQILLFVFQGMKCFVTELESVIKRYMPGRIYGCALCSRKLLPLRGMKRFVTELE